MFGWRPALSTSTVSDTHDARPDRLPRWSRRNVSEPPTRIGQAPPKRGWKGPGGGRATYIQPPREWRGTTNQVCGFWPYSVGAGAPLVGPPLGKHLSTGATVCGGPISWFEHGFLTAPTAMVLALNGTGKSSLIRRMAIGYSYFGVIPLVLGDLKPDYPDLVREIDGEVITVGRGRGYLNPLDMTLTHEAVALLDAGGGQLGDREREKLRAELLIDARGKRHAMVAALATLQRRGRLDDVEDTVLAAGLDELDRHHKGEPVLSDLLELIEAAPDSVRAVAYDRGDMDRYHDLTDSLVRTLRGLLQEGRIGDMFSRRTSTRPSLDRPAVFDVSSIREDQTDLVAAALTACWGIGFNAVNTRMALGEAGVIPMRHYLVVIDELWRVLQAAGSGMVDRINSLTRLNRQVGAGLVMITHTIADLEALADEHDRQKARGFAERAGMLICGALPPAEHDLLRSVRDFSDAELRLLSSWQDPPAWSAPASTVPPGVGKFLVKVGGRPGIPFQVGLTDAELQVGIHDTSRLWRR